MWRPPDVTSHYVIKLIGASCHNRMLLMPRLDCSGRKPVLPALVIDATYISLYSSCLLWNKDDYITHFNNQGTVRWKFCVFHNVVLISYHEALVKLFYVSTLCWSFVYKHESLGLISTNTLVNGMTLKEGSDMQTRSFLNGKSMLTFGSLLLF